MTNRHDRIRWTRWYVAVLLVLLLQVLFYAWFTEVWR
jgi:hypothetical protein